MLLNYKHSQTSVILRVKLRDSSVTTGAGLTGLTSASTGLIIGTIASNEATSTAYTVAGSTIEGITTLGTYAAPTATKCRFKEVDSTNHKGVYEIQLADARFAVASAKSLMISLSGATNLAQCDVLVPLHQLDPYDSVRGGLTALPNAAADAAGGLPISDAGGLDLDTKLAETNEVTAARMAALTDWINGGRLDLILDIIAADVVNIDGNVDSILADTGTDGVKIATGQTITALTITTLTVTNNAIGWNASWDAEVQSEVEEGLVAKGLDHLVFTSVTGTDIADNSIIAKLASKSATADWDSFTNTTDSLEAQADAASSGVTVAYAIPAAALSLLQNNSALTILKYDSLSVSLTGLGSVTNKTETYFVVKNKKTDADAASIILISEGTGLEYVEGAAYGTAGHGSFTWTNTTTGAATIAMDEAATGTLTARTGLYWAVKVIRSTGAANTLVVGEGSCDITDGIIRAVS